MTATDTLRDAETWLRTALDLAVQQKVTKFRMEVQIHLACVATLKGDENEAVELAVWSGVYTLPRPCRAAPTAMLAVRRLTGRHGWMMKVLQRRAPEDGAEWRG